MGAMISLDVGNAAGSQLSIRLLLLLCFAGPEWISNALVHWPETLKRTSFSLPVGYRAAVNEFFLPLSQPLPL